MIKQAKYLLSTVLLLALINQACSLSSNTFQAENRNLESEDSHTPSTEATHAIINIISWGFLIDLGIVFSRLGKGRKITIRGKVIPAQAFHGAIMLVAVFLSGVLTIVMLSRSDEEKQLQNVLYEGNRVRTTHKIIGYTMGILSIIEVALGSLNYGFLKNYNVNIRSKLTITKAHKFIGTLIWLLTKVNLILGPVFYKSGDWMVPVYVYLGFMAPFVIVIPSRLRKQYWTPKRLAQIVEAPSSLPRHKNLLAAINNGYSTEDIIKQFPGVKWLMLGSKVYDVTDWIHPAGNFTIEPVVGKEIGRYFYGNYSLEGTRIKAHKHSGLSHAQLSTFYIGQIKDPESILLSSHSRREVFSHWDSNWRVKSIKSVSPTTSQIDISSPDFLVKNFGTTLSWLGAHFKVSFAKDKSMARLYTAAMCLSDANYKLRQSIYHYFDDIMAGSPSSFIFSHDYYLTPQDHLPLFIKKYSLSKKGFSRAIHNLGLDTPIRIEGPILGNMTFSPKAKGEYCIICAGNGILSIIDFLNYFLWQSMYEIIKDKAGVDKAEQINILKLPFDDIRHLKVDFIGSFPNKEEILGLDIIKKLAECSKKYKRDNFTARIRGYADDHIEPLQQHFSYDFLRKNVNLNQTRYYIVGPRQLNEQVTEALVSLGVPKGKIILL